MFYSLVLHFVYTLDTETILRENVSSKYIRLKQKGRLG